MSSDASVSPHRLPHILQVAYYEGLSSVRATLLENNGYAVTSVLGNAKAMKLARHGIASSDLVVIGFSTTYAVRMIMLGWLKRHYPEVPVLVLQSHTSEKVPDAECVTLSEDPSVWLAAVATCLKPRL
jgi:DNA-binding NtrC family response regulator